VDPGFPSGVATNETARATLTPQPGHPMITRRHTLQGALALLAASQLGARAQAMPPIIFAHGNGEQAPIWLTTLWRFESNGYPPTHLHAINFTDPLARSDDAVEQAGRSSSGDQLRELNAAIDALLARTGASRVALVGSSRGGYAIRNTVQSGGAARISHVVLCGVPNRGIFDWEFSPGSEFNTRSPFLKRLNGGENDVVPGTAFLTLRSDGYDKYAQPDGRFVGRAGTPTGITSESPELRGATNLVLGQLDHREIAFHPRAFREIYKFIAGSEPARLDIVSEPQVTLDGQVTGFPGGVPTNRPVTDATVEVYRVAPGTGERLGAPVHRRVTGADGRWGPAKVEPTWLLEFVIAAPGHPVTHIYRSPFPRSSNILDMRPGRPLPGRPLAAADKDAGAVVLMSRPRGYFGIPRDVVLLDGKEPTDVAKGVAADSLTTLRLPASEIARPIVALFNEERIVCRGWPAAENHITIAELTY
jgi:pimeloyl-ACP methyl ester carboxylesterase